MRKAWDITLVATQALVNLLPQQIMPTHNAGVYLFALREIEIYQIYTSYAQNENNIQ